MFGWFQKTARPAGNAAAKQLENKVAIVTGGGMGLGEALCAELARRGAVVVIADIDGKAAEQVATRITQSGGRVRAV